ncbi:uncharacterized protein DUF1292 [Alkalibaculum bacchi]|uniref:UPF0473 protein DES36_103153 n=1 Tax=Alkalibaculum bacchi TaxID=645887 RepID=A0A366ICV6_9FIRM|nr:DUF1292 domain-containing protein [Alkalibaculum bacchi]RBP68391.1 uncharacterized protein DUF1292 [Alkalibaculum bacchi]
MNEENENRIVLLDEEGNEVEFELIVTIEKEGVEYALLLNVEEEEGDMYAFRIDQDEEGDLLIPVEDEDEIIMIQELYDQLAQDEE